MHCDHGSLGQVLDAQVPLRGHWIKVLADVAGWGLGAADSGWNCRCRVAVSGEPWTIRTGLHTPSSFVDHAVVASAQEREVC